MRKAPFFATVLLCSIVSVPANAEDQTPPDVKGIYLLAEYPAVTIRPGNTSSINLKLQNYRLEPERFTLSVDGVPPGWTATLLGGGQPVGAAMPASNANVPLELRLDIPKDAATGSQTLTVRADGNRTRTALPINVTLARDLPAKLSLQPQLPELRGSAKSNFEYQLTIKNDSGKKLLVSLAAQAPENFDASFTEAYGTQELTAIPVEAGQSKDVKLKVRPPSSVRAGRYEVAARVSAEDASANTMLALDITGQPKLELSGREGILSARASAGAETSIPIVVANTGTATAEQIELSGSGPSGWKVTFEPKVIDRIAPEQQREVQALVTPATKAIAGDYVTSMRASARGETASQTFRMTVTTSTIWGAAGFGLIGAALLVLVGAVARFGRR